jgi:hypothetical protein
VLVEKLTNTDVVFAWTKIEAHAVLPGEGFEIRVPLAGLVDLGEEKARTEKELGRVAAEQALNALLGGHVATELGYVAEDLRDLRLLTMEVHAESKSHLF